MEEGWTCSLLELGTHTFLPPDTGVPGSWASDSDQDYITGMHYLPALPGPHPSPILQLSHSDLDQNYTIRFPGTPLLRADHRILSSHNHVSQYLIVSLFLHIYIDPTVSVSLENSNKHNNEAAVIQDGWEEQTCVVIFLICTSSYFCLCSHMITDWSYLVILSPIVANMCLILAPCEIYVQQQNSIV